MTFPSSTSALPPLLQLRAASIRLGPVLALADIHLRIDPGERVAFIGANGSGKSTLLRVLHGLIRPTHGALTRDDRVAQAMVFQRPWMLRTSVRNNIALGLWLRGASWSAACHQALQALERVDLAGEALRHARALSGGQQQRVALARAWSLRPGLLFLDEPTSSLDPHAKREVEALMDSFAGEGTTLVFASHNLGQVKRLASRVIYLEAGRIEADLPVDVFFNATALASHSPAAHAFVQGELA